MAGQWIGYLVGQRVSQLVCGLIGQVGQLHNSINNNNNRFKKKK